MTTLVLLPGMDGTGELFARLVAAMPPSIRTRVVSYPPDLPLGYPELEALVRTQLPADDAFVILGESFSGPIAASIAASAPARLAGLILCGSFVRCPRPALRFLRPIVTRSVLPLPPDALLARVLLGQNAPRALRDELRRALSRIDPTTLRARLRAVIDVDVSAELARVRVPVLCLRATRDRVVPRAAANWIVTVAPQTRAIDIDASHMLLQAAPAAAATAIQSFLNDLS
ncbi:MAG: alpha/beta hydrolase [Planctomycetes bacterium]|nr:alpha/beta hydrolase [Planctomycetota bacterium]